MLQIWFLPCAVILTAIIISFPLSIYLAWIMDGKYTPLPVFAWIERKINSGSQNWQQYATALLVFCSILFMYGYAVLALQQWLPLNPDGKIMLAPSTLFHTAISFMTNTDLQHYAGETYLSNFSQIFFVLPNMYISSAVGLSALCAIIRGLRGDANMGNFFLDMWRGIIYLFLPIALIFAVIYMQQGSPMTFSSSVNATTLEKSDKTQTIVVGPVAAFESIKMLGTNGGGFYNMNSAHPFENPTGISNFFNTLEMMIFPFALVLMYGIMLKQKRHSYILFGVMLFFLLFTVAWTIYYDTLKPNPAISAHPGASYVFLGAGSDSEPKLDIPPISALPVEQHLGNLEGKELRFGTSAGATFAAITTSVTCGAINAELDSFNPMATLAPLFAIAMNCFFGGIGGGMTNMLLFIITGIFLAGMMVGRTPEYLGKKIEAHEVKLALIAMLMHTMFTLLPLGLFAATIWGINAISNPGAHGLTQMTYQFLTASGNNGSAFNGLNVVYGFFNNVAPSPEAVPWDIATGIVMLFSRFIPIIAPMAMAAALGVKKSSPFSAGTLRIDTLTFGFLLIGTAIIVGALWLFPVVILGPVAEYLGPIPFHK